MSTPIPPNSELEGLELYAPRRPRPHPDSENEAPAAPSEPDATAVAADQSPAHDDERSSQAGGLGRPVHARVDEAIKLAIEVGRSPGGRESAVAVSSLPPAANLKLPRASLPASPSELSRDDRHLLLSAGRRHSLDPEILPEPPSAAWRGIGAPLLIRLASVVGFAAVAAYGLTMISTSPPDADQLSRTGDKMAAIVSAPPDDTVAAKSPARLVVENQQAFANDPVSLGVSVDRATGRELLLLAGLTSGTRLSAGVPVSDSSWQLPLRELRNVYMYAPKDFVGVMNTAVNLLAPNDKLVDARAVQFAWVVKKPTLPPPVDRTEPAPAPASIPAVRPSDHEQDALLMKRGQDLLNIGDIAGARRAFAHLADAGIADAAVALGATYDPGYLAAHNVVGVVGDAAKARALYQRAAELGSSEAKNMLERMAER